MMNGSHKTRRHLLGLGTQRTSQPTEAATAPAETIEEADMEVMEATAEQDQVAEQPSLEEERVSRRAAIRQGAFRCGQIAWDGNGLANNLTRRGLVRGARNMTGR